MKTGKYVTDILEQEVVESIWYNNPDDDYFFALASTENKFSILKVKVPNGKISGRTKLSNNIHPGNDTIFIEVHPEKDKVCKLYFLKEVNKSIRLVSQNASTGKTLSFGQVQVDESKRPLMSFNSEIVVRIVQTVSGQQGSSIHVSSESGNALWTSRCDKVSFFLP